MISKDQFIYALNKIKKYRDIENKVNEALSSLEFCQFSFCEYESLVIEILENAMEDNENDWIGYWVLELDFGERYQEDCVTEADGAPIDISTADKLYDFLISNMQPKKCSTCKHMKSRRCTGMIRLDSGSYWTAGSCSNWEEIANEHNSD